MKTLLALVDRHQWIGVAAVFVAALLVGSIEHF